ncbi:protein lin-37 homolog isoform X2 [Uranotaenia lowii]|nr:protein lin-37 homolog isoform X2 [Uranotaenia lowii]
MTSELVHPVDPSLPLRGRPPKWVQLNHLAQSAHNLEQSFIIKLFDRRVDISRFGPNSPLYPVCRSWMKNNPRHGNSVIKVEKEFEERYEEEILAKYQRKEISSIEKMPKPEVIYPNQPFLAIQPFREQNPEDLDAIKDCEAKRRALLIHNKKCWRMIRHRWQKHRETYLNRRYRRSYELLDALRRPSIK